MYIPQHVNVVDTDVEELYVLSSKKKASFMHKHAVVKNYELIGSGYILGEQSRVLGSELE